MSVEPDSTIGPFTVLDRLGAGGMATVYRVQHHDGSLHALKILHPTDDERLRTEMLRRFLAEGEIQARLLHPHILPVNDIIEVPTGTGLLMELLIGEDLGARLRREGAQSPLLAVRWTLQILSALSLVHHHGIIHRDLKPGNIFLENTESGHAQVRVMDFGLARVLGMTQTKTGVIIGSLCYLSPEQIQDNKTIDGRSDLFSVGALLFEMLTGIRAFIAESEFAVMKMIRSGANPSVQSINPDIPDPLAAIVAQALDPDPSARFADADAFAEALTRAIEAGAVPSQISKRINNTQEDLLRKTVHSRLKKSLAKLSRRRGGISGLPELPQIQHLLAMAGRLPSLSLPALRKAAASLPEATRAAQQALLDWEDAINSRTETLRSALQVLQRAQSENQAQAISAAAGRGPGVRRRWRTWAAQQARIEADTRQEVQNALKTLPVIPSAHPLAVDADRYRQDAAAALARPVVRHPPPLTPWLALVIGVPAGLLGAVVWTLLSTG